MNNLGALLLREGKYAKAEELLKRVVEIKRRVMGEEHPSTLTSIGALSTVYRNLGRYAEAESLLTNLVEVRRRVSGPRHRDTLSTMNALGNTYLAEAKYDQADAQFASVLEMERQALGEQSPETLTTLFNQAELRFRQNRLDQAQQLLEQVLNLGRAAGPNAVLMRGAQSALGRVKLQQRSFEQAEALLRPALEAYRKSDFDSWSRYAVECELGASLAGMGRHDEAEKLLAEGYPELVKRRDAIPQDYRTILDEARHWAESEGR
jgi:tetratricopeptide (TPR) repeat protein